MGYFLKVRWGLWRWQWWEDKLKAGRGTRRHGFSSVSCLGSQTIPGIWVSPEVFFEGGDNGTRWCDVEEQSSFQMEKKWPAHGHCNLRSSARPHSERYLRSVWGSCMTNVFLCRDSAIQSLATPKWLFTFIKYRGQETSSPLLRQTVPQWNNQKFQWNTA